MLIVNCAILFILTPLGLVFGSVTVVHGQELSEARQLDQRVIELYQQGKYGVAIPLAERALEIRKRLLGESHPDVATSLRNLGQLNSHAGLYNKAEPFLLQATRIYEKALNLESAEADTKLITAYATCLNELGLLYVDTGRYDKAEPLFVRAAQLDRKALGPEHPDYAADLNNLAVFYETTGRFERAEALYLEASDIEKKTSDQNYAASLNNLAQFYINAGRYNEAEPLFVQALELKKESIGKNHPDYAISVSNLAALYKTTGRNDKAERLYLQAAEIDEKALGLHHPTYATDLNNLGSFYHELGRYNEAEQFYLQALEIRKIVLGEKHPDYATVLTNLAALYQATGRSKQAFALCTRAMEIEQANLQSVFAVSSEQSMRRYLNTVSNSLDVLVTIAAQKVSPATITTALAWLMRRKGIVLDTLIRFRRAQLLAETNSTVAKNTTRLRYLRQQISNFPLNPRQGMGAEEVRQQLKKWREESDSVEADLNRSLANRRPGQSARAFDLRAVRLALNRSTALIEFVRSGIYDFKATRQNSRWKADHYFAFVLTGNTKLPPAMIDLGEAERIDRAVANLRARITQFADDWKAGKIDSEVTPRPNAIKSEKDAEREYQTRARQLYDLVFARLRKELSSAVSKIYVAPDDQLDLVPFEALVDPDGKYLIESYRFAYLSSGRDLVQTSNQSFGRGTVVFADPDYDMAGEALAQKAKMLLSELAHQQRSATGASRRKVSRAQSPVINYRSLSNQPRGDDRQARGGLRWEPLPASANEGRVVAQLLNSGQYGPVKEYLKSDALEDIFKGVRRPRILHVSTHGFFPVETNKARTEKGPVDLASGNSASVGTTLLALTDDPLLQSGLVLAGANTIGKSTVRSSEAEVDDGWVTAEEIGMMDLQGTELVVLSACGSGLGATSRGEGVYGLRRAFQNAGARAIVSTLFEVPDKESGEIMSSFYRSLKYGKGKLESLRTAQLQMIGDRRRVEGAAHPFFWASFVLTGKD